MITAAISQLKNKHYLATFVVQIDRSQASQLEFFASSIKPTYTAAENWAVVYYKKWLQKELHSFLKQRTTALIQVGAFTQDWQNHINQLMAVKNQNSLAKTCQFIVQHQNNFRALVPGRNSQQHYWHYTIEDIIANAANYIMLNQKLANKC